MDTEKLLPVYNSIYPVIKKTEIMITLEKWMLNEVIQKAKVSWSNVNPSFYVSMDVWE